MEKEGMSGMTAEEYLRAFYYLQNRNGVARASALARYLGVSKAGVSVMFSSLSKKGLLKAEKYLPAKLTPKGLRIARRMTFRHRVLESFLSGKLRLPAGMVHAEASRMEHAVSDSTVERIYMLIGRPKRDPHGQPIAQFQH